jgi:hypothetical protein
MARGTVPALVVLLLALLAVGVVSGTILRHAVQALPVLAAAIVRGRRVAWSPFAALAVFAFWLVIMSFIWLFLLGLPSPVSGRFSAAEIALTLVIGLACAAGLVGVLRDPRRTGAWRAALAFVAFAALQVGAMWLSLRPALAER